MSGPRSPSDGGSAASPATDRSEESAGLVPAPAELLGIYLKGLFMGAADAVPGVSGGTIALVTGIYERLIAAITAVDPRDALALLRAHTAEGRAEIRATLERVDAPFLVALGLGVVTAVVTVAQVIEVVSVRYPAPLGAFFFGLIAASAVVLYGEVDVSTLPRVGVAVAGVALAVAVTGFTASGVPHDLPLVLVAGAVAICAMILPGVSGAFLLLVLGQYEYMLGVLNGLVEGVLALPTGGSVAAVTTPGVVVAVFLTGAAVGLLSVAHAIDWALTRYRVATLTFLVSLMVGGLRLPAERVCQHALLDTGGGEGPVQATGCLVAAAGDPGAISVAPGEAVAVLGAGLVGAVAVLAFDHFTDDLDYA
jgi:putative membrane protein